MPWKVVPSTDRFFKEDFHKTFFKASAKVDKNKKTMHKQIDSSTDKIISKTFPNYFFYKVPYE